MAAWVVRAAAVPAQSPEAGQQLTRRLSRHRAERLQVPHVSVLDPVVNLFGTVLGQDSQNKPGSQRQLDSDYYRRISAIDFAVSHDDGINMGGLKDADILLVGVSRTSKTPTSKINIDIWGWGVGGCNKNCSKFRK